MMLRAPMPSQLCRFELSYGSISLHRVKGSRVTSPARSLLPQLAFHGNWPGRTSSSVLCVRRCGSVDLCPGFTFGGLIQFALAGVQACELAAAST